MFLRLVLCFGAALLLVGAAAADVPQLINFQGVLLDTGGDPVTTPTTVIFAIWNADFDGDSLWSEEQSVTPDDQGRFATLLGSVSPIPDSAFAGAETYLSLKVDTDPEMTPRQRFASVAYAYHGVSADAAAYADSTDAITDGGIDLADIGQNDATENQIIKWDGAAWAVAADETGTGTPDNDWTLTGDVLYTGDEWGLARAGNVLYGNLDGTHVNLGVACTTGTSGQNYYYNTVGGGVDNTASGNGATIGGGAHNDASGDWAMVGGGWENTASNQNTTVGGGHFNTASGEHATVAGGAVNTAGGNFTAVGGGLYNKSRGLYSVVAGGGSNVESDSNYATGEWSVIGGGYRNSATYEAAAVLSGQANAASGENSVIAGGWGQQTSGGWSFIGGGSTNVISGILATIAGGSRNTVSGMCATVPGGYRNTAGGMYSFAAGNLAKANHDGSFCFAADYPTGPMDSVRTGGDEQMVLRADGGLYLTNIAELAPYDPTNIITTRGGAYLSGNGTTWTNASDRNQKENFSALDREELLTKIATLPITRWNYKDETDEVTHIGPVAQDFHALFGVGGDDTSISTIDPAGIALAAIQGLYQQNKKLEQENEQVKAKLAEVLSRLAALESR